MPQPGGRGECGRRRLGRRGQRLFCGSAACVNRVASGGSHFPLGVRSRGGRSWQGRGRSRGWRGGRGRLRGRGGGVEGVWRAGCDWRVKRGCSLGWGNGRLRRSRRPWRRRCSCEWRRWWGRNVRRRGGSRRWRRGVRGRRYLLRRLSGKRSRKMRLTRRTRMGNRWRRRRGGEERGKGGIGWVVVVGPAGEVVGEDGAFCSGGGAIRRRRRASGQCGCILRCMCCPTWRGWQRRFSSSV